MAGSATDSLERACPAKVNLGLAITGRREDGFHELVSLVVPLQWGDRLCVSLAEEDGLTVDPAEAVPVGGNLVLEAATAFRRASGLQQHFDFQLDKRIPVGAGLGGGSSDAAAALQAMQSLCDSPLDAVSLEAVAAELGSDVPLFLREGPSVMRGRGEVLEPADCPWLEEGEIALIKPSFLINTAAAYKALAAEQAYCSEERAEHLLAELLAEGPSQERLANDFETILRKRYLGLDCLLTALQGREGVLAALSGSGSACYLLADVGADWAALQREVEAAWGAGSWLVKTKALL